MATANVATVTNMAAQNQAYAYAAHVNQNPYRTEKNYQAQAYQAQVFQNHVTISRWMPPDMGYNSKVVM